MRPVVDEVLVGGRYRLRQRLGVQGGSPIWGAADEALGRPVMVWVFPPGFRRADAVTAAARAVCRLDDPRLMQVFDADDRGEFPYVVTEWPTGRHLGELLRTGPAEPVSAAAVVAEAAGALTVAHAAGLAHLCLRPSSVWWGAAGEVKVTGLAIAAAAAGIESADPVLADTRGLGRVLYAALTGYWPGAEQTTLPAAPRRGDHAPSPCQVRPGIPGKLGAVACRALSEAAADMGPPIVDPAQLARELVHTTGGFSPRCGPAAPHLPDPAGQHTARLDTTQPLLAAPTAMNAPVKRESANVRPVPGPLSRAAESSPVTPRRDPLPETSSSPRRPTPPAPRPRRARRAKTVLAVMLMLATVVLLGAGGWYLAHHGIAGREAAAGRNGAANPPQRFAPAPRAAWHPLQPASAQAFDPYGGGQGDNSQLAPLAIDHDPATAWHTDWYTTPRLGNLKPGTGLLLNMGRVVIIARARIRLGDAARARFQLRAGLAQPHLQDCRCEPGNPEHAGG
jgi:eukaryotic-like serine/threonine-protein kinase